MKIYFITPCYKKNINLIKNCINSIKDAYAFFDKIEYEQLICNDGDNDNIDFLKKLNDKKIKVFFTKHHGVSYTRNFLISKIKEKESYLFFLDADDVVMTSFFQDIYISLF